MYEDKAFFAKVYLSACVYFSSKTWLDYRLHENSCVAVVERAGHYRKVRQYFLDWLRSYLETRAVVDTRVGDALRVARHWNSVPGIVLTEVISQSRQFRPFCSVARDAFRFRL